MLSKIRQQSQRLLDPESQEDKQPSFSESAADFTRTLCPSLTYQERVIGCVTCFALGFILSFGSTFRLAKLIHGHPAPFAMTYTFGNLLSLFSTAFFVGPCSQISSMFHKKRRWSTVLYLFFIVLTLVFCFVPSLPHRFGFVVISILCQFSALVWYSLSYIPYGRNMFVAFFKRICGCKAEDEM